MILRSICLSLTLLIVSIPLHAERIPTKLRVRAVSRDAKVIGDKVGGARITVLNAETGEILSRGIQLGGTGDTELIMVNPRSRGSRVYDADGSAFFETTLVLERPTRIEVQAEGPLGFPQAKQKASKTLWVVPGAHIVGEGILLEIHGFIIQVLKPLPTDVARVGVPLEVRAKLGMT